MCCRPPEEKAMGITSGCNNFEIANGELQPSNRDPTIVAHQLELDVCHTLTRRGSPTTGQNFAKLQAQFRRKGYIDD